MRLRRSIDSDAIWSSQSPADQMTSGERKHAVELRRSRVGIEDEIGLEGQYVAELDPPTGTVVPRDDYLAFGKPQETVESEMGAFPEPFNSDGVTSRTNIFAHAIGKILVDQLSLSRIEGLLL
jgi:hypothetical protein